MAIAVDGGEAGSAVPGGEGLSARKKDVSVVAGIAAMLRNPHHAAFFATTLLMGIGWGGVACGKVVGGYCNMEIRQHVLHPTVQLFSELRCNHASRRTPPSLSCRRSYGALGYEQLYLKESGAPGILLGMGLLVGTCIGETAVFSSQGWWLPKLGERGGCGAVTGLGCQWGRGWLGCKCCGAFGLKLLGLGMLYVRCRGSE